jgi:tRNA threonylcarbamoyl adenosine modification protein YeaZ
MKILALEFSSAQRSVAVVQSTDCGPSAIGSRHPAEDRKLSSSEVIETSVAGTNAIGMIDAALRQAQLEREQVDCFAVGLGPGSYNGIRLAIALAQGWQLASDPNGVKVLGLNSARCIAVQAQDQGLVGRVTVVIDAQRGEFYVATYHLGPESCQQVEPLRLAGLEEVRQKEAAGEGLIGPDVGKWFPSGRLFFPRAAILGRLALDRRTDLVAGEKLEPIYLRETKFVKAPPPRTWKA